jgi:glycosyltransferase involved in cell wall biosynthesis
MTDWDTLPLVSCVMPTFGRPAFVHESVAMFLAQDYAAKELILLNDCPGQTYRGQWPGVRIVNVDRRYRTLGEKWNAAIKLAAGELIAVWDEDEDVARKWWVVRLSFRLPIVIAAHERLVGEIKFYETVWSNWRRGFKLSGNTERVAA